MPDEKPPDLTETLAHVSAMQCQLLANQKALLSMLSRALELSRVQLKDGETTEQTFARLRRVFLERMLLNLGDTQPKVAEELQKILNVPAEGDSD